MDPKKCARKMKVTFVERKREKRGWGWGVRPDLVKYSSARQRINKQQRHTTASHN